MGVIWTLSRPSRLSYVIETSVVSLCLGIELTNYNPESQAEAQGYSCPESCI